MKIDINIIHLVGIIILGAIAISLVLTHQTTVLAAIVQVIIGTIGMSFVPAVLRVKTPIEKEIEVGKSLGLNECNKETILRG